MNHKHINEKLTWKMVFLIGSVLGILIGTGVYLWLQSLGNDLKLEINNGVVIVKPLE